MPETTSTTVASTDTTTLATPAVNKTTKKVGRPPVYKGNVKRHIEALIRKHNASVAREILNANPRTELAKNRNLTLVPQPLGISMPTMGVIAKKAGIKLFRGRPKLAA